MKNNYKRKHIRNIFRDCKDLGKEYQIEFISCNNKKDENKGIDRQMEKVFGRKMEERRRTKKMKSQNELREEEYTFGIKWCYSNKCPLWRDARLG